MYILFIMYNTVYNSYFLIGYILYNTTTILHIILRIIIIMYHNANAIAIL